MKITVTITKADVMTEVRKQAAYVANKVGENQPQVDQITMLLEQNEALDTAYNKAIDEVSLISNEYLAETTTTETSSTLRLEMPDNFGEELTSQLQDIYVQAVEHAALKAWFDICLPTMSEVVNAKANSDITDLRNMLSRRRRPNRYRLPDEVTTNSVNVIYE